MSEDVPTKIRFLRSQASPDSNLKHVECAFPEFVRRPESSDGDEAFVGIDLIFFATFAWHQQVIIIKSTLNSPLLRIIQPKSDVHFLFRYIVRSTDTYSHLRNSLASIRLS